MATDSRGLTLSGATDEQAAQFDAVIRAYFDYRLSTFPDLKPICAEAPDFAMAHILKGYLLLSLGSQGTVGGARACHAQIEKLADQLTERERGHLDALLAWSDGNITAAVAAWDKILFAAPLDLLAIKMQHFALFWAGQADHMRDVIARVMPAWNEETAGWANLLGMSAFALEETGSYELAEQHGRESVRLDGNDLWSIHAVAHILEMQGRLDDGLHWLNQAPNAWDDRNPFKGHLWWHLALFALEKGQYDRVLELYDTQVRPAESTFYLDVQNSASLLARLEFAGVDVGDRWSAVADSAQEKQGDHVLAFTEPHCTMLYGATGRIDQADTQLASLKAFAKTPNNDASALVEPVLAPLCESIRSYYQQDYQSALQGLLNARYDYQPLGGSHAQRDVFSQYLIDAAWHAGDLQLARGLLTERVARRPNSVPSWQKIQKVCESLGDSIAANKAATQAAHIGAA